MISSLMGWVDKGRMKEEEMDLIAIEGRTSLLVGWLAWVLVWLVLTKERERWLICRELSACQAIYKCWVFSGSANALPTAKTTL